MPDETMPNEEHRRRFQKTIPQMPPVNPIEVPNIERVGRFEKVSFEEYVRAQKSYEGRHMKLEYDSLKLPTRATTGSAGYDFYAPFSFTLLPPHNEEVFKPGESILIPTGIRCNIKDGWFLMLVPRSSLGFKYRLQMDNTVSVIDSDYYGAENEGHIMLKITNDSNERRVLEVNAGDRIAQGIFLPYGITEDDNATGTRTGGIGSTNKEG